MPTNITFKTKIDKLQHLVGMHYLEIPQKIIKQLGGKLNVRLFCTVNNVITYQCGIVALGNGLGYISINTKRMKQINVNTGDTVTVVLKRDESKYGMTVPEELQALLEQDEEGFVRFEKLSKAMQRYIIYYVSQVKKSEKRIARAILLITNLKKLKEGKETFREMLGLPPRT